MHHRITGVGYRYHIVTACNNFEYNFKDPTDFLRFVDRLKQAKRKYNVKVYGYCIMNNHVHLLVHTPHEDNISDFMWYLNGNSARDYNRAHGRRGHFWNERFHSTVIETDTQFFYTLFYIEFNMVRAKGVKKAEDWRWSSFNAHAHGVGDPVVDLSQEYLDLGKTPEERQKAYREMAKGYLREKGLVPQPVLTDGLIIGSKGFVEEVLEQISQRKPYYKNQQIYEYQEGKYCIRRKFKKKPESNK